MWFYLAFNRRETGEEPAWNRRQISCPFGDKLVPNRGRTGAKPAPDRRLRHETGAKLELNLHQTGADLTPVLLHICPILMTYVQSWWNFIYGVQKATFWFWVCSGDLT